MLKLNQVILNDLKNFILSPPPNNSIVQITILWDKDGIKNKFYPKYHVFFSENINQHILTVKKKPKNATPNYVFSLSKEVFDWKSEFSLGKLRSNFIGTEFTLYDSGENPKKGDPQKCRKELGFIEYEKNILGLKGPRKLRVIIPDLNG